MALSIRDYPIIKAAKAAQHQGDVRYNTSRCMQCSCMSLVSDTWALFTSPAIWDKFDLDSILRKRDHLFEVIGKFRYLRVEDQQKEVLVQNSSINGVSRKQGWGNCSWGILDIYLRNCKWCSAN